MGSSRLGGGGQRRGWAFASGAVAMILLALQRAVDGPYGKVLNPLPIDVDRGAFTPVFWVCWFGILLSLFGGVLALRARYRAGGADQRRQVLWLAYGALLLPLWLGGTSLWSLVFGSTDDVAFSVLMLLEVWPAVAVAVAVTRHGLYAIDRLFNRTLVYTALTALLAGAYAIVALLAGRVGSDSTLAASLATLAAAVAFRPLREWLQSLVDRRFARQRFEGVRMLRDFLDDVRDGRSEPEDVGAVLALALGDPQAEVLFRLPRPARTRIASAIYASRCLRTAAHDRRSGVTHAR